MKNVYGNRVTLTLFGESHGRGIGAVLDGLPAGLEIREEVIRKKLDLRRPSGSFSTARKEPDPFTIESGAYHGYSTGAPLCILIPNQDARSKDYGNLEGKARPGHCDYPADCKYHGFEDPRGGGHFSGRLTAVIVAAGAILADALEKKNILTGTHLKKCAGWEDRDFSRDLIRDIRILSDKTFPVLDENAAENMKKAILAAKEDCDSVGGILETVVVGLPTGIGEPWFDSVESLLAHGLFSIPAVKGVEFGDGFALVDKRGSQSNDAYRVENQRIITATNHQGGIGGGITNGMPLLFRCAVKPTPSIAREQESVDFRTMKNITLSVTGRHDPCIAPRARAVVDAVTALTLTDLLTERYGSGWLAERN